MNQLKADMHISSEVQDIVALLDRFARSGRDRDGGLRSTDIFPMLLQHAADSGRMQNLGDLAFHGKYLWKLYGSLAKYPPGDEIREAIEGELTEALTSFRAMLASFTDGGEEGLRSEMEARVLPLSGAALEVIMNLAHDFGWLKNWELEMQTEAGGGTQAGRGDNARGDDNAGGSRTGAQENDTDARDTDTA